MCPSGGGHAWSTLLLLEIESQLNGEGSAEFNV